MPYDLAFERIIQTDNKSSLELNKLLAKALVTAFPEIQDSNAPDSTAYFTHFAIDSEDEFMERHFRLHTELDEMHFGFEFWMNTLWLEIGAAGNPDARFTRLRRYAVIILQQGFRFGDDAGGASASLEEGLAWHLREYQEWTSFVEHVTKITVRKVSAAE